SEMSDDAAQEIVIMAAADFAEHQDVERARELLAELKVPNESQYVALVAERLIRTNRGPVDQDIENVVRLADALNVSTVSMIAYVSTPTPLPTDTPIPTPTRTNTPVVPTATPTAISEAVEASEVIAAEAQDEPAVVTEAEAVAVEEPPPTNTPALQPIPTDTPPPPPTDTPEPEPASTASEFDYVITKQRMLTKEENGGCLGMHQIFVNVIDAQGNPIQGVELGDVWGNPGPVTGHKGADEPGLAVYDLYKNGFKIFVKHDPTAGRQVTSQVTELLSSNDWEIGIPRLIEAGYCPDESTCRVLWNSGVFGEGNNSLCWGHYSWEVIFQRTW
ncbi:MAG: hypothetical protein R3264_18870, partial [Anaerolineae bacterium]|nr:hypothetical protein [Anaerolineae bacterium]